MSDWTGVFSTVESIKADLQSAIRSLGGAHAQDTFEDAFRFLADPDNQDWLVIFDNADDPQLPLKGEVLDASHREAFQVGVTCSRESVDLRANFTSCITERKRCGVEDERMVMGSSQSNPYGVEGLRGVIF